MTTRSASTRALAPFTLALLALAGCSSGGGGNSSDTGAQTCALASASPLRVTQMTPAPNSQYVSVAATVSLQFNTCLDLSSVTSTSVQLTRLTGLTGVAVAVTRSYDAPTATLKLVPTAALVADATYQVTVQWVLGAHGETMSSAYVETFHTRATPDVTAPTTTASPGTGRYKTAPLVSLLCSDGATGGGCARTYYSLDGSAPTTLYTAPILVSHNLTIKFYSVDFDGNAEASKSADYVIDTTPPTILSIDPQDGATGVPRTVKIKAHFSEEMAPWTLTSANVTMSPSPARTYSWDGATDTLTIAPLHRLECGTTYTVTFGTGVEDLAGNGLVAPVASSFTVHTDCEEPATTASVADGVYVTTQSVTLTCTDTGGSGCARIVYTLDGSVPSLDPVNGTVVSGASAGPISIGVGDTVLRFYAEDNAGNREAVREERYSISTTGFTYVATGNALARGIGPVPAKFVSLQGAGVVNAFFRDPTNGRLYRATDRGLYASDDGVSWSRTTFIDDVGYPAKATAVYAQGSLVFAGTSAGLYRSYDGGATFEHLEGGRVHPPWIDDIDGDGQHVYVASNAGLRVSHDRGETFVESDVTLVFEDVQVEHATGMVFLATSTYLGGLRVTSVNGGGTTVYDTTNGMPSNLVRAVAVTPGAVYAATDAGLAVLGRDGSGNVTGVEAVRTSANGLGFDDHVLKVRAVDTTIYAITTAGYPPNFYVSTNGGQTFSPRALTTPASDLRSAVSLYVQGSEVYVGAPPGWFLSTDGALTFVEKDLPSFVRIKGSGSTLYAAASGSVGGADGDDGLLVSTDGFRTFTGRGERNGMGQGGGSVNDLVVDGTSVYAATDWGVAISTNAASTFVTYSKNNGAGLWDLSVDCLAVQTGKIWACASNSLDLSTNGGSTFTSAFKILAGLPRAVAASGSNVYYADTDDLRVSNNGGAAFATRTLGVSPQDLALAPDGTVYVATSSGVFVSIDAGTSFSRIAGVAATTGVYSVDATAGALYVGIDSKLGISTDGGQTFVWRGGSDGLPGTPLDTWYQP